MNNLMNQFFRSSMITSIFLFVLGGLLLFKSEGTIVTISYVIGGILISLGVVAIIRYVLNKKVKSSELDILYGIVTIILGVIIISNPKALASIIPIVLGVCIVLSSSAKLQYAFELKRDNNSLWIMTMVVSIVSTLCGIILIFNPFQGAKLITQVVGIFIMIYAVLDIISTITIKKNVKTFNNAIQRSVKEQNSIKDAEVIEEKSETKKDE